jgi:hypothetical protein
MSASPKSLPPKETVIFVHIPKTGGSTLTEIIDRQYEDPYIFKTKRPPAQYVQKFQDLSLEKKQAIQLIRGHLYFGFHELLPPNQPYHYITMLREPIERVISHYYWALQSPKAFNHPVVNSQKMSLKEFVSSGIQIDLNNCLTRYLSGVGEESVGYGECYPEMLERAKENLKNEFACFGFTEKFDETLILFKKSLGWKKSTFYIKKNVTQNRPNVEDLAPEDLTLIKQYNEMDIELYRYALDLFKELTENFSDIDQDIQRFTALNQSSSFIKTYFFLDRAIDKVKKGMGLKKR